MTDQVKPENQQDELLRDMYPVALQLKLEGKNKAEIKQLWGKKGLNPQSAKTLVNMLVDTDVPPPKDMIREAAWHEMKIGAIIAVAGIVISFMSYQNAVNSPEGGTYTIVWGIVVFGIIIFGKGLAKYYTSEIRVRNSWASASETPSHFTKNFGMENYTVSPR